ncbi:MAG: hypothetical protein AB9873_07030 [Syntrophobacteraceae bacterium]
MVKVSFGRAGPLATVFLAGLTGAIGQVLILRELLVLFYGNELSSGLFFSSWLVWTAAGSGAAGFRFRARVPSGKVFSFVLLLSGLALPLSLLVIRGSRIIWSLPMGETVSLFLMALICFLATFPLCLNLGALFSIAWSGYAGRVSATVRASPIRVYICEGLGAAAGGGIFYFLLLPHVQPLHVALAVSALLVILAAFHAVLERLEEGGAIALAVTGCAGAGLLLIAAWGIDNLDAASRRWQWGDRVVTVRDTPFHNLALLEQAGLYSLFGNGLWYFSAPDPQVAEFATHPALLQHAAPKTVLLIGGGVSGLITEALKHPDIACVEYIEPDPQVIALAKAHLPVDLVSVLTDPSVRVMTEDAGSFIKAEGRLFDVILLNIGEPMNLEQNRFYTVEFFHNVKRHLASDGVFSFSLSAPPEMVGPAQGRLLRSLNTTLKAVFPEVRLVMGGEGARFLAGVRQRGLESDPEKLVRRVKTRQLRLNYLNDAALHDLFSPFRARYVDAFLNQEDTLPPNEDFRPVCALQSLLVWSVQIHPPLQPLLLSLTSKDSGWLWTLVSSLMGLMALSALAARRRWAKSPGVVLSVLVMGGAQMILQLSLLFGFQILRGFVYTEMALIVSGYMVGTALGAGLCDRLANRIQRPRLWLKLVQLAFILHFAASVVVLFLFHSDQNVGSSASLMVAFPVVALLAGGLGGVHFSLAVRAVTGKGSDAPRPSVGGGFYAVDLLGAAAGALTASLVLLPVYGLVATCAVPLALLTGSLGILLLI